MNVQHVDQPYVADTFIMEKSKMTGSSGLTQEPILSGCHASLAAVADSMLHHKLLEQLDE